jgi:hypothetical protein
MSVDLNQLATRVKRPYPELFHLSFNGELEGTWSPKSPDGDYDDTDVENMHGEPTTPRISLSPTVEQSFQAIYANVKHLFDEYPRLTFYVYTPEFTGREKIVTPEQFSENKLIHDAHITQEHSILTPLNMKLMSRVTVYPPERKNQIGYYAFGVTDKEYYGWLPGKIKTEWLSLESTRIPLWLRW